MQRYEGQENQEKITKIEKYKEGERRRGKTEKIEGKERRRKIWTQNEVRSV